MGNERREIPNDDDNPFVNLGDLLSKKVSVATLATAIETKGIYTWDRFGRFGQANEKDKTQALDYLAKVHEYETELDWELPGSVHTEQHPLDATAGISSPFSTCGWTEGVLPDFAAIRLAQAEAPQKPAAMAKRKAPDKFVAALVRLLVEIAKKDSKINIDEMPGTKADFRELAIKVSQNLDHTLSTFDTYIEGFCKFKSGARPNDYYRKLFPEYSKK